MAMTAITKTYIQYVANCSSLMLWQTVHTVLLPSVTKYKQSISEPVLKVTVYYVHDYSVSIYCELSCIHKQYIILREMWMGREFLGNP